MIDQQAKPSHADVQAIRGHRPTSFDSRNAADGADAGEDSEMREQLVRGIWGDNAGRIVRAPARRRFDPASANR